MTPDTADIRQQILDLIRAKGPLTTIEIGGELGLFPNKISNVLKHSRAYLVRRGDVVEIHKHLAVA